MRGTRGSASVRGQVKSVGKSAGNDKNSQCVHVADVRTVCVLARSRGRIREAASSPVAASACSCIRVVGGDAVEMSSGGKGERLQSISHRLRNSRSA